jgi:hypothetical protein
LPNNFATEQNVAHFGGATLRPRILLSLFATLFVALPAEAYLAPTQQAILHQSNAALRNSVSLSFFKNERAEPTPYVNGISPNAAKVGRPDFDLRISGAGFSPNAVVHWEADNRSTELATRFVGPSEVIALVPGWLLDKGQTAAVTVRNPNSPPDVGTSNVFYVPVTVPTASLVFTQTDVPVQTGPMSVAVADFNRDGKPDLVVPAFASEKTTVLLGNGDGTFTPAPLVDIGFSLSVAVGDFNGDRKPDFAVTSGANVFIVLGNGDGTFNIANHVTLSFAPSSLVVADFNRDGKLDIATASATNGNIAILLGNGDGTFRPAPVSPPTGSLPAGSYWLGAADFNRDGKVDLALMSMIGSGPPASLDILLGCGDGSFESPAAVAVPDGMMSLNIGDFNRDGILDLGIANLVEDFTGASDIVVLLGNGDGSFRTGPVSPAGNLGFITSIPPAFPVDFNGDGKLDLAVPTGFTSGAYVFFLGKGDGTFTLTDSQGVSATGNGPAAFADFNGDGRLDMATVNSDGAGAASVLIQQPVVTLSKTSLDFGAKALIRTITVTAGAALQFDGFIENGPFDLKYTSTSCRASLDPGLSCNLYVTFISPDTGLGPVTGTLAIVDNNGGVAGSTQIVSLSAIE